VPVWSAANRVARGGVQLSLGLGWSFESAETFRVEQRRAEKKGRAEDKGRMERAYVGLVLLCCEMMRRAYSARRQVWE
jgi:hypothetical protein